MDINRLKNLAGLEEKWEKDVEVKQTGEYADKTVEELQQMYKELKQKGPHKKHSKEYEKMREIAFAIRAKRGWKYGVEDEEFFNEFQTEKIDETVKHLLSVAGIGSEPVIETVEDNPDVFIVFESKHSPKVIGVFRSAADAKNVLKKFKQAVGKGYKTR